LNFFIRIIIALLSVALSQDASSNIYWNSLSTSLDVGIPLGDDPSLIGGRIQLKVRYSTNGPFTDLGKPFTIEKGDVDDVKICAVPADQFESKEGFAEGSQVYFNAIIWDRAGNSLTGTISDSVLTVDETVPFLSSVTVLSSNALNGLLATSTDSITFDIVASESIISPRVEINGDDYEAIGVDKSWKVIYPAEDAKDGPIQFNIYYEDLAGNPGETISTPSDSSMIIKDGTEPELEDVMVFTSNSFDSSLAVKDDSVFLQFSSDEPIRDVNVSLNGNVGQLIKEDSLTYIYYHIFTESDSERIIPISIDYNDMAGNPGETVDETTDDSEVTFDMTPPAGFSIQTVGASQGEIEDNFNLVESDSSNVTQSGIGPFSTISPMILYGVAGTLGFFCLLIWISWFNLFSKAGQAGWKALVPFFNIFVLTKILNKPIWWILIYLIIPVSWFLVAIQISKSFGKKITFALGLMFLPFVFYPILAFGKSQFGEIPIESKDKKDKKSKKPKKKKN